MAKVSVFIYAPSDYHLLCRWMRARKLPDPVESELPGIGFVASYEAEPVAASFLRQCEGNVAIIDSLVADPLAHRSIRDECIEALVDVLVETSKSLQISRLLAFSVNARTLERAAKRGFSQTTFTVMARQLS